MDKIIDRLSVFFEYLRLMSIACIASLATYFDSTQTFMYALIMAFAVNVYAGMAADGVSVSKRINFQKRKFVDSLIELVCIAGGTYFLKSIADLMNKEEHSVFVVEMLTWIALYFYIRNSFRNLSIAYPKIIWIRVVYHLISFHFSEFLPANVMKAIGMAKEDVKKLTEKDNETKT